MQLCLGLRRKQRLYFPEDTREKRGNDTALALFLNFLREAHDTALVKKNLPPGPDEVFVPEKGFKLKVKKISHRDLTEDLGFLTRGPRRVTPKGRDATGSTEVKTFLA